MVISLVHCQKASLKKLAHKASHTMAFTLNNNITSSSVRARFFIDILLGVVYLKLENFLISIRLIYN
jgi:hypothetical protein